MTADTVRITGGGLTVDSRPGHGFVITSIRDGETGAEALWARDGHEASSLSRWLGESGAASVETFGDLFVGGWFEMFPSTGYPGVLNGMTTLLHGEVVRLPWTVVDSSPSRLTAAVATLRTPFHVTRTLAVDTAARLSLDETIRNTGGIAAEYTWGHHPCFDRSTFADGTIGIDVRAARVPTPFSPHLARMRSGPAAWPLVQSAIEGETLDARRIPPDADGSTDHVDIAVASGRVRLTAPRVGRAFVLEFDPATFPHALLWRDFHAPAAGIWGAGDTFAIEPSSGPGRDVDDARAEGGVRVLGPGQELTTRLTAFWEPI